MDKANTAQNRDKRQHNSKPLVESIVFGPLTRHQIHQAARERIHIITREFSDGFAFLEKFPRSVTVFGSSRVTERDPFYEKARTICHRIAGELGYAVTTGGGPGIMEAANRGAFEANGTSVGITIKLPHEQVTNSYINHKIDLSYFFARKVCLSFSAEAYLFFPGGFGTLDELFEILTLVQTQKIVTVPVVLVGSKYWKPLESFIRNTLFQKAMVEKKDLSLFMIEDDDEKILDIVRLAPVRNGLEYNHKKP